MFKTFTLTPVGSTWDYTANVVSLITNVRSYRIINRYHAHGELELVLPYDDELFSKFVIGHYITKDDDPLRTVWIITDIYREKILNGTSKIVLTCEGFVAITKRRAQMANHVHRYLGYMTSDTTTYPGIRPALVMKYLASGNFEQNAAPGNEYPHRAASISSDATTTAIAIRNDNFSRSFKESTVYQILEYISRDYGIGMRSSFPINKNVSIEFYVGRNKTVLTDSGANKPAGSGDVIVFSELNENIKGIYEQINDNGYKNALFIEGAPDITTGRTATRLYYIADSQNSGSYGWYGYEGLALDEEFIDGTGISRYDSSGTLISDYDNAVLEYAKEWFVTHQKKAITEIEIDPTDLDYVYGPGGDFYLGDTISMSNEKGEYYTVRVTEDLEYYDVNGMTRTLTLTRVATYDRANLDVRVLTSAGPK